MQLRSHLIEVSPPTLVGLDRNPSLGESRHGWLSVTTETAFHSHETSRYERRWPPPSARLLEPSTACGKARRVPAQLAVFVVSEAAGRVTKTPARRACAKGRSHKTQLRSRLFSQATVKPPRRGWRPTAPTPRHTTRDGKAEPASPTHHENNLFFEPTLPSPFPVLRHSFRRQYL